MSALLQTLIGAFAAMVGGIGGAMWQTRHAEVIARSIRFAERREQCLLRLNAELAEILALIEPLYRQAEKLAAPATAYQDARGIVGRFTLHWETQASGVLADPDVVRAY